MSVWFQGENEIECSIEQVARAVEQPGEYFVGVVGLMPGLVGVELVSDDGDAVTIRTNEGLMKRTNVSTHADAASVVVEFDENYQAGSKVTTDSHFVERFVADGSKVTHSLTITDLEAPGVLGFFYRRFGSSKMGNAFLTATATYLRHLAEP